MNNDTALDVVAVFDKDAALIIFYNNGTGSFGPGTASIVSNSVTGANGVAAGDINGDSYPDLVVAGLTSDTITVFISSGGSSPSFTASTLSTVAFGAFAVAIADMNGDGRQDIVSTLRDANIVVVYKNNGDGTFTESAVGIGSAPRGLAIGDVDQNGQNDVVVANTGTNSVGIYYNAGGFSFSSPLSLSQATGVFDVAIGDLNADCNIDVVAAAKGSSKVLWFQNNGTAFNLEIVASSQTAVRAVALGDITGDGEVDIVSGCNAPQRTQIIYGDCCTLPS